MVPQSEALWGGSAQIRTSQWSSGLARCSCGKSLLCKRSDIVVIFFWLTFINDFEENGSIVLAMHYKWNHKGKPWGCCTTIQQPLKWHNVWRNSFMTSKSALPPCKIAAWFCSDCDSSVPVILQKLLHALHCLCFFPHLLEKVRRIARLSTWLLIMWLSKCKIDFGPECDGSAEPVAGWVCGTFEGPVCISRGEAAERAPAYTVAP